MSSLKKLLAVAGAVLAAPVLAAPVSFTALPGITGGTLAATAVYQADLSTLGLANILSISIMDNSAGTGGSPGQFTGFDLDAIVLSYTNCADAACVQGLSGLDVFSFGAGTMFTPGSQRDPADPKLFGTGAGGNTLDNAMATLAALDGESTTEVPGAFGFISLGENGVLNFNLTSAVSTAGLFLYIGEVGNNGEVAASNIVVRDTSIPEPGMLALFGLGAAALLAGRRRIKS